MGMNQEEITAVNILQNNFNKFSVIDIFGNNTINTININFYDNICKKVFNKMETVCHENAERLFSSTLIDFRSFRTSCSDFIQRTCSRKITAHTFAAVGSELEGLYSNSSPSVLSTIEKKDAYAVEVLLKALLVYARYLQQQQQEVAATTLATATLPPSYSTFAVFQSECLSSDDNEMGYLLTFRAMMRTALEVIPARRNKMLLIAICALLEGSGRIYITGGTQSSATSRRMIIFEQESGLRSVSHLSRNQMTGNDKKSLVVCGCGAIILRRTLWKHVRSLKHKNFAIKLSQHDR